MTTPVWAPPLDGKLYVVTAKSTDAVSLTTAAVPLWFQLSLLVLDSKTYEENLLFWAVTDALFGRLPEAPPRRASA